jgi:peroxiredoxin
MKEKVNIPDVTFKTRVRDESIEGPNPYRWEDVTTDQLWGQGRHIVFSLPGAFTPTCSTYQLPGFEKMCADGVFDQYAIETVSVISVNDAFVMNAWAKAQEIKDVQVIPDGSGRFTRMMGMLVDKDNLGFGHRSWRYAMVIRHGVVEKWFEEPGREDNHGDDPYGETSPENVLNYLQSVSDNF